MVEIIKNLVSESKYDGKCPYEMSNPIGITIHNTANEATADNEIAYMIRNDNRASFHFAVDENHAVQGLPLDRSSLHASDGKNGTGNRRTISIEIARSTHEDETLFDKAEDNAAQLCAQLCKDYGWTTDDIYTHQHWDTIWHKYCPHKTLDRGWDRFLNMVQKYIDKMKMNESEEKNMTREEKELYVNCTYVELLGRLADQKGLDTYCDAIPDCAEWYDNLTMYVDDNIKHSDEYRDYQKREYIKRVYNEVLKRDPDPQGLESFMSYQTYRNIFRDIYNSPEARSVRGE